MPEYDPFNELLADTRALVEDLAARGVWAEAQDATLPPASASFQHQRQAVPAPTPAPTPTERRPVPERWSALASQARAQADAPQGVGRVGLQKVRDRLGECSRCGLGASRRNIVFGVGSPDADLVIIGEAPGYHEDRQGEPFVGKAGAMLDAMLTHVLGLSRSEVYIANIVKCRPPDNRNPTPEEIAACRPVLEAQIKALQPKVMLVLGTVALKALFELPGGITRQRGVWLERGGVPTLPTFHPAYLLRNPERKRDTFNDLKALRQRYDALNGRRQR